MILLVAAIVLSKRFIVYKILKKMIINLSMQFVMYLLSNNIGYCYLVDKLLDISTYLNKQKLFLSHD